MKNLLQPVWEKYQSLDARDKRAVQWLGAALLPFLIYLVLVYPVQTWRTTNQEAVSKAESQLQYMHSAAQTVRSLRGSGVAQSRNGRTLAQVVAETARQKGLVLSRMQPRNDHELQVWLGDSEFDEVLPWLYELESAQSVVVSQANITPADEPGVVRVSLKLKDGGA